MFEHFFDANSPCAGLVSATDPCPCTGLPPLVLFGRGYVFAKDMRTESLPTFPLRQRRERAARYFALRGWVGDLIPRRHTESESKPESDFSAEDLRVRLALDPGARVHERVRSGLDPGARVQGRVRLAADSGVRVQGRVRLAADPGVRVQGRVRLAADPGVRVHGRVRSGLDPGVRVHGRARSGKPFT
jgi:hypothetical protein